MKGEMLSKMISLAVERHAGQFDKGGRPYILHPLTVMHRLRTDDEELQCIAVGHDLIEDTDVSKYELERQFNNRIADGIDALTRYPTISEAQYRRRIIENLDAIRVKIEDLRHNSDICRLKGLREKDIARIKRYYEFYVELIAVRQNQQETRK